MNEIKDLLEKISTKLDENKTKMDELEKKVASLDEAVTKLKNSPAEKVPVAPAIISSKNFLGRNLERQGLDLKCSDEDRVKISKYLVAMIMANSRTPNVEALNYLNEIGVQKAPLAEGTGSTGGFFVPDFYEAEVLRFSALKSWALSNCRIWPMSSDTLRIPAEGTTVSVAWTAEGSSATESEPTFAEIELNAKRLDAYSIASNELLMDSMVDVVSYLTERFGEAIGQEIDNQFLNGTGAVCSGILTAAAGYSVIMGSGQTSFSSVNCTHLSEMISKLRSDIADGATFLMHRTVLHYLRSAKDSNNAFVYAQPGGPVPQTIWGLPYATLEKCPSTSGTSTPFIALANPRYFCIGRRVQNMTLDVDPYSLFRYYQTQFRIVNRWALKIGLANAFVRLLTAAS